MLLFTTTQLLLFIIQYSPCNYPHIILLYSNIHYLQYYLLVTAIIQLHFLCLSPSRKYFLY